MKQGGNRSRGDHGSRQPVMERHHTVFGKAENTEYVKDGHQKGVYLCRKNTGTDIGGKIQGAGQHIDKDHGRQDKALGGSGQINNIFSGPGIAFLVLMMRNKWISADTDNLIKEIQGKKIIGKSHSDGTEEGQGKTGVKPGLGMFLQAAHIAHGVKYSYNPEKRSGQRKYHGKGINPEGDGQARQNIENPAFQ